jgi:hypothetical protein
MSRRRSRIKSQLLHNVGSDHEEVIFVRCAASSGRLSPVQFRKAGIVAIVSDPSTGMLDGQSGKPGIGDASPPRDGLDAKSRKYRPMSFAGPHDLAMRLVQQIIAEGKDLVGRTRLFENPRIGGNPRDGAQGQRRHSELRVADDDRVEPPFAGQVMSRIFAECVNQYIDIGQDHLSRVV